MSISEAMRFLYATRRTFSFADQPLVHAKLADFRGSGARARLIRVAMLAVLTRCSAPAACASWASFPREWMPTARRRSALCRCVAVRCGCGLCRGCCWLGVQTDLGRSKWMWLYHQCRKCLSRKSKSKRCHTTSAICTCLIYLKKPDSLQECRYLIISS